MFNSHLFDQTSNPTDAYKAMFRNNSILGPLSDSSSVVTDIFYRTAQQQLEMVGTQFLRVSEQLKRLSGVHKPEELINLQKTCLNENIAAVMENSQHLMQLFMENISECAQLSSSLGKGAVSATKHAVKTGAKVAEKAGKKMRNNVTL